jgi:hypothetical protein
VSGPQNETKQAEAKGGRSEARCSICSMVAFEDALYSLGMIWYRRSREDSPGLCKRRPEVW